MSQYLQTPGPPSSNYPQQQAAPMPKRHGLALWVLILGFIGILFFPLAIAAIVMGFIALSAIKKSQGWLTGSGMVYGGMVMGFIGIGILAMVAMTDSPQQDDGLPKGQAVTPGATLSLAEANIITDLNGIAYSNSEGGLKLAEQFAVAFKGVALESTDDLDDGDEFITHCQLHDDSVAFVVHVPKLRKFNKESKEQFCDGAWMLANGLLMGEEAPDGMDLVVAIKGNLLYENMYFGKFNNSAENPPTGRDKNKSRLEEFFKGAPAEEESEL